LTATDLIETEVLANQCEVEALQALGHFFTLEEYIDISLGKHNHLVEATLKAYFHITLPDGFWKEIGLKQGLPGNLQTKMRDFVQKWCKDLPS